MEKKNVVFLTVLAVATLLTAVVGTTFAYFTATVTNTTTPTATTVTTANNLGITYSDGANISDSLIVPGWVSTSKTITVVNNGDVAVNYQIDWTNVTNGFSKGTGSTDDLVYSVTMAKSGGTTTQAATDVLSSNSATLASATPAAYITANKSYITANSKVGVAATTGSDSATDEYYVAPAPSTTDTLVGSTSIEAGETHTYVLTMYFVETGLNQDQNQSTTTPAHCSDTQYTTQATCEGANETWTPASTTTITFSATLQASIVTTTGIQAN